MTLILQGDDQLRYHPETGLPIGPEDYTVTELSDGRRVYNFGDCNSQVGGAI